MSDNYELMRLRTLKKLSEASGSKGLAAERITRVGEDIRDLMQQVREEFEMGGSAPRIARKFAQARVQLNHLEKALGKF